MSPLERRDLLHGWRALVLGFTCALLACDTAPRHDEFSVGMERGVVQGRFGEPLRSREMHKTGDGVWGPIEGFWSRAPMGSTVEIWSYRTTHEWMLGSDERAPGVTELYFVDGSRTVSGLGFAPDGVVYEAAPPTSP